MPIIGWARVLKSHSVIAQDDTLFEEIPALATVPAIALTGFGMKTDVEKALACGYNAHLSKPVDPDKLSALIKRLASKQKEMAS